MLKKFQILEALQRNSIIIQAGLFILFFVLTLLLSLLFQNTIGNNYSRYKIQNVIIEKEGEIANGLNDILLKIQEDTNYYFSDLEINVYSNNDLNFYIYKNDSLVAWSDNAVIPTANKLDINAHSQILKLTDGYYLANKQEHGNITIIGLFLLEHSYPFENEYLQNRINKAFNINKKLSFVYSKGNGNYIIHSNKDKPLFEIAFDESPKLSSNNIVLLFLFYFLAIVFLYNFLYLQLKRKLKGKKLILALIFTLAIARIIIQYFQLPNMLYGSQLFLPTSFAASNFLPSLGDLFLTVYTILVIVIGIGQNVNIGKTSSYSTWLSILISFGLITVAYTIYSASLNLIENLILNSNINFDVSNLFSLNYLSFIGLSSVAGILFVVVLSTIIIVQTISSFLKSRKIVYLFFLLFSILILVFNAAISLNPLSLNILFIALALVILYHSKEKSHYQLASIIPLLLILSFISAISLNEYVHIAEQNRRKSIVRSVATNQDPQVEYQFREIEKIIYTDSILIHNIRNSAISFDSISSYLQLHYFAKNTLWSKYDLQITICDQEQELVIKPDNIKILCDDFFYKNLLAFGKLTTNKNLYHLKYGTGQINYLGLFRFYEKTTDEIITYTIYLEINSKLKRKGFTKLLSEKGNDPFEKLKGYSLAAYNKDTLVENYGSYSYPELLSKTTKQGEDLSFYDKKEFNHLYYKSGQDESYILSKRNPENLAKIAPFSYLFILFSLLFIVFSILFNNALIHWELEASFTTRLQLSMIAIIIVSFTIISYFSSHYIISLNNEKNNQRLKDLSTSLQMEFEHKVRNVDVSKEAENKDYLQSLSVKFSKVFDTDINLYNLNGNLISGTRPEMFEKYLLSRKINPEAYNKLAYENESLFVTNENIGKLTYSSAYLPFHNDKKEVVAYLNLPHFARQSELQNEISSFLMTLMNVYTFIIVLSIIVILLISNYISRPLRMIKEKLQKLTLGERNEKIEWGGEDEIGHLITEYNHMVDQMAIKADLLAKSERESAWREMAKQVAHEIKNPLTPMKLSVQYLIRSWNEKDPDWEDRLHRLSETLIQQIDTLSDIASAFSDFAKMPKSNSEKIELNDTITHAIELYADYDNLQINFTADNKQSYYIYADKKQLIRVFNNLIKNSIQSFELNQNGFVDIDILEHNQQYIIHLRDNGCGIAEDQKEMIFVPNFTTKTTGTGLGLAMVKNIILNLGGSIRFESEEGKGTVFTIALPKFESNNNE